MEIQNTSTLMINARKKRSNIRSIENALGASVRDPKHIENILVPHFRDNLSPGNFLTHRDVNLSHLSTTGSLNEQDAERISKQVDLDEIKQSITCANPNKSPDPDGFNMHFSKVCWSIIGEDVAADINGFFKHGTLLKQVNNTFVALIPQKDSPTKAADYRPISLANELYKGS